MPRDRTQRTARMRASASAAVVLAIAVAAAGCGDTPKTFDAQGFVDAANDQGAGLVLGDPLISSQKDVDVYGIGFDDSASSAAGAKAQEVGGEGHGSASLTISADSDAATAVYSQCEATGTFVCYRANNAALVFDEGTDPHALAKVDAAIRAMASG